jgi:hypothetical protein
LGLTEARDLSAEDLKKVRHLSLIELTAFFDAFGIQLKRNKTEKVKGRGKKKTTASGCDIDTGIRACFSDFFSLSLFLSLSLSHLKTMGFLECHLQSSWKMTERKILE